MAVDPVQLSETLLAAVGEGVKKARMFKSTLAEIHSILGATKPVIQAIKQHNDGLGHSREETERLTDEIRKGIKLVLKCLDVSRWNYFARMRYQDQLEALMNSLVRYFTIEMQAHIARDLKETLLKVRTILNEVKKPTLLPQEETTDSDRTEPQNLKPITSLKLQDDQSGKMCYMFGARGLSISWGDDPAYWSWTTLPESRFQEVAELRMVCWLEIRGKISTRDLSSGTQYAAYLVFKMIDAYGFHNRHVKVTVGSCTKKVCLDTNWEGRKLHCRLKRLQRPNERKDGWWEIKMGEFSGLADEVEMSVTETKSDSWKSGLILEGIEVRPKQDRTTV